MSPLKYSNIKTLYVMNPNLTRNVFIGMLFALVAGITLLKSLVSNYANNVYLTNSENNNGQTNGTILRRFDFVWYKWRRPLLQSLDNKCGYIFPNIFLNGRTSDQLLQMIGLLLMAVDSRRMLVVPENYKHVFSHNYEKFELLKQFHLVKDIRQTVRFLPTKKQLEQQEKAHGKRRARKSIKSYPHDFRLVTTLADFKDVPCGKNVGIPKQMSVSDHTTLNSQFLDFEPTHYFVFHKQRESKALRSTVKRFAMFNDNIVEQARYRIASATCSAHNPRCHCKLIAMHVRLTDFYVRVSVNWNNTESRKISKLYLSNALDYIERNMDGCISVIVLTDDPLRVRGLLPEHDNLQVLHPTNDPLVDMCIIASSDAIVTTIGNFAWMGAYLSEASIVTYQSNQRAMYRPLKFWTPIDPCSGIIEVAKLTLQPECIPATRGFYHENFYAILLKYKFYFTHYIYPSENY